MTRVLNTHVTPIL